MAYFVYRFGSITLPDRMTVQDMAPIEPQDTLVRTVAGVYSNVGLERAPMRFPHPIKLKAMQVSADTATFRAAIDALRAAVGTTALLYRRADSDGDIQKALCYLQKEPAPIGIENHLHQEMDFSLQQLTPWQGDDHAAWRLDSGEILDDGLQLDSGEYIILMTDGLVQTVSNGGNLPVSDVKLTVMTASFGLAAIALYMPPYSLIWDSTLPANSTLVIDCGARSVLLNGENAYDALRFGPEHKRNDWFVLAPGDNTVQLGALGTKTGAVWGITFKDWWA